MIGNIEGKMEVDIREFIAEQMCEEIAVKLQELEYQKRMETLVEDSVVGDYAENPDLANTYREMLNQTYSDQKNLAFEVFRRVNDFCTESSTLPSIDRHTVSKWSQVDSSLLDKGVEFMEANESMYSFLESNDRIREGLVKVALGMSVNDLIEKDLGKVLTREVQDSVIRSVLPTAESFIEHYSRGADETGAYFTRCERFKSSVRKESPVEIAQENFTPILVDAFKAWAKEESVRIYGGE